MCLPVGRCGSFQSSGKGRHCSNHHPPTGLTPPAHEVVCGGDGVGGGDGDGDGVGDGDGASSLGEGREGWWGYLLTRERQHCCFVSICPHKPESGQRQPSSSQRQVWCG